MTEENSVQAVPVSARLRSAGFWKARRLGVSPLPHMAGRNRRIAGGEPGKFGSACSRFCSQAPSAQDGLLADALEKKVHAGVSP